jgi:nitrogen fixation protein NifX
MKVAFATEDGKRVDSHFGRCSCFSIFEINEHEYQWLKAREITEANVNVESEKIDRRVEAVKDCTLLFVCQIGPTAAAKVTRSGVMPLKVEEGTEIMGQLDRLQAMLQNKPPLWLVKAMRKAEEEA